MAAITRTRVLKCDSESITFSASGAKPIYSDPETEKAITFAVEHLTQGHVVAFPTETVYGLGAIALDASAATKIFSTKGRPSDNPLIVHISSLSMLSSLLPPSYTPSPAYTTLMRTFWPGPLTLLFPADPSRVPKIITAGHPTVAVRMPAHPVARALIAATGTPIAAPSANASGKPSPTRASHVLRDLGTSGRLPLLLDGGFCGVGLESTVVDGLGADGALRVLRPGGATVEALVAALADLDLESETSPKMRVLVHQRDFVLDEREQDAPTTPGMKYRHYAPGVPVTLLYTTTLPSESATRRKSSRVNPDDSPLLARARLEKVRWLTFPLGESSEPACAAQRLFEGLLSLEEQGVERIYVEEIPEEHEGLAFMNRVKKAAAMSLRIEI
ncbi:DHBP synthase RibB-like alpha/beta domain-containing protein [Multifurca ochricompacta]|uniref:Threonylcarbamoyl-AMP synthase n=1 Tax=Multifurca ochricompacta TaxID=376703 RepID=A0AAD4MBA6_9AGAM|nr:DHBP synthase RibB-like alpha/beta domain-containing protein [Multifurca ochricompacta]